MEDYNFWNDLLDTYQSLTDWLKLVWILMPPGFLLGVIALVIYRDIAARRTAPGKSETLAYTIYAGKSGRLRIYAHEGAQKLPTAPEQPRLPNGQRPALDELSDF